MTNLRHKRIYEFEDFRLDAAHLLLYQNERQISLAPKVVETLLALVERHGEVLSKDELMKIVWADSIVEEGNLFQNLHLLRKILGKTGDGKPLIETLKRRGYRFNGDVVCVEPKTTENSLSNVSQSAEPKISPNGHHFNVERRVNVLALADWKPDERNELENGDSRPKTPIAAIENNPDKIQPTEPVALCLEENKPVIIQPLKTSLPANETAARSINQKANNRKFIFIGLGFCLLALTAIFVLSNLSKTQPDDFPNKFAAGIESRVKFYWEMSEAEKLTFIRERTRHIQTLIDDTPTELDQEALQAIEKEINDYYVKRKNSLSQEPFEEGLRVIYGRASQYAPIVIQAYEARRVPPALGVYQAMIESEYLDCYETNIGTIGLFLFKKTTARKYGLMPKDYCSIEKQSDAAAAYMSNLISDFDDNKSLALMAFNVGEGNLREYLRQLRERGITERNAWAIRRNGRDLKPQLREEHEGFHYVPRFFAAAIVGETPEAFELSTPPLSTLRYSGFQN